MSTKYDKLQKLAGHLAEMERLENAPYGKGEEFESRAAKAQAQNAQAIGIAVEMIGSFLDDVSGIRVALERIADNTQSGPR